MSSTFTSNLNLRKPEHRDPETLETWDQVVNGNMDKVDIAFGARAYSEQNYISNSDSHSLSLNKLDMKLYDVETMVLSGVPIARKAILSPEYPGGVLYDGGVTPTGGTLISDYQVVAPYGYNFYKWISTVVGFETYYVVTRWRAPEAFTGFVATTNKALIIDIATEDTGTDSQVISTIYKDGVSGILSSKPPISSTVAGTWYAEKTTSELLRYDATDAVLASITAGNVLVIIVGMKSKNSKYAKIGDVTIQYNG